ncbi:sulfotransferase domain-containing protein [Glycomyces sp. NPDC047010]|uniref:sulfotransferase domain-containing protein n=1 Tax=Glycomyces sp. NPDC047010 TaxID=3155023 RepID=UPI0033F8E708
MIVWLSSYPRSGNTFFRIALQRLYGVPTYVVYDVDGVAAQIGPELMDARERPASFAAMRASPEVHVVKTHRQRGDAVIAAEDRAICLVRDGRDSTVSWARLNTRDGGDFAAEARTMILRRSGGTGGWGQNVLSWRRSEAPAPVWVRFEELIADPVAVVREAVGEAVPELEPVPDAQVPSFAELQAHDASFFRAGATGMHRAELPPDLHELFWAQPDNAAAMAGLGYGR